ncbi:MAG TPA: AraC family transcriptional regulator [Candidatus Eisenbergiella merdavium]|uniref:AraC family transcriptional regulator n=1 Tax=Candidatus Eisenbergiella merdavium TaxID=2838551 RepID=A0A9D2NFF6_9FIRM|nr:AraC family transcriptional regulator [Candidatus Eisenbergiella merdavium]
MKEYPLFAGAEPNPQPNGNGLFSSGAGKAGKAARESIHENVIVEPDLQVRCFSYEDAGIRVPAHWHHSLEILLIATGSMEANINDMRLLLHEGDFVLINSGDIHSTGCSEHSRICVLQIPYPLLKSNIPEYNRIRFCTGPCGDEKTDAAFRLLLQKLQDCGGQNMNLRKQSEQRPGLSLHFKSLLYELLYLCVSRYQLPETDRGGRFSDTERARLIAVTDYVNEHYTEPIALQDTAAVVALNPEYFCRFFKKSMGITFLEFVNQVRFSHVCQDILHTDLSITEILARHGFTNYKLFRRMFHETYGCTPSAKRKEASGR